MCRMVGMISPSIQSGAAEAALLPSWQHLVGAPHALRLQAERGCVPGGSEAGHTDSWGIGWFDAAGQVSLVRQTGSAAESGYYVMAAESAARGGAGSGPATTLIGHLRKASMGAVTSENAHPVRADYFKKDGSRARPYETLLVAHNGTIKTPLLSSLRDDLIRAKRSEAAYSDNDTVVLAAWLALLSEATDNIFDSLTASLRELLRRAETIASADFGGDQTQCYTGLNLLIGHPEGLFVLRQFSREPDYYTLYCRSLTAQEHTAGGYIIASERTDDHPEWELIEPGILMQLPSGSGKGIRKAPVASAGAVS